MTNTGIFVNGVEIPISDIAAEAQNHPAPTPDAALSEATQALVIREILVQRARATSIVPKPVQEGTNRRETEEEALVRQLLDEEVPKSSPNDESCRMYYENNKVRFVSPTLYEASHILFSAKQDDPPSYIAAVAQAENVISELNAKPTSFADLAGKLSDCPSGKNGGSLGQITRGDTVPEVETFLLALEDGQLCPVPVRSRYGVHVLRLERCIVGRQLPYEIVHDRIADYLEEAYWRRNIKVYVQTLAEKADIQGIDLNETTAPQNQ